MSAIPKIDSPILFKYKQQVSESVREDIAAGEIQTVEALRKTIYERFVQFFKTVGDLSFEVQLWNLTDYKDESKHNSNQVGFETALETLFEEADDILNLLIQQFTLMTQSSDDLVGRINSTGSRLEALEESIEAEKFLNQDQALTVITDTFSDTSKVDFSYSSETAAAINTAIGAVTLNSLDAVNRGLNVNDVSVTVFDGKDEDSAVIDDAPGCDLLPLQPAAYEGNRFDFSGSARPQSGIWRIETKNTKMDKPAEDRELQYDKYYVGLSENVHEGSILEEGEQEESSVLVEKTTYTITKLSDSSEIATNVSTITREGTEGDFVSAWVLEDGTSRIKADDDTETYIATAVTVSVPDDSPSGGDLNTVDLGGDRITPESFIFDDRAVEEEDILYLEEGADKYANTLTREDFVYVEVQPTKAQLLSSRRLMFDDDIRTFWEIEYTPIVQALEDSLLDASGAGAAVSEYQKYQTLAESYLQETGVADSLEVEIKVDLDNTYVMNYIDLAPLFFDNDDTANFEVISIRTQRPGGVVTPLDDFVQEEIGTETNEKLSQRELQLSGTQNSYAFKAQGFWTFQPREVKTLFIRIKQSKAIANPYQLLNVQLLKKTSYTISESKSNSESSSQALSSSSSSSSKSDSVLERGRTSRLVQMSYLETVLDQLSNGASTGQLSGVTAGDSFSTATSNEVGSGNERTTNGMFSQLGGVLAANAGAAAAAETASGGGTGGGAGFGVQAAAFIAGGAALDALLSGGGTSSSSSSVSKSFNDSGFQINRQYMSTIWKRPRFAIGIREIGLYSRSYEELGTVSSIPYYEVLRGNKEIELEVSEKIPVTFMEYDPTVAWIEYYVVIDGKETRIAPTKGAISSLPHKDLPSKISLTGEVGSTVSIRFMARLKRPSESSLLGAGSLAPLLSKYSLKVHS